MIGAIARLAAIVVVAQLFVLAVADGSVTQRGVFISSVIGWAASEAVFALVQRRMRRK